MANLTLSQLGTKAMDRASNQHVSNFVNTWVQWAIEEIWNDSLWDFRVREATTNLVLVANDISKALASDFAKPHEFRIILPSNRVGQLRRIEERYLKLFVPDIGDLTKAGTPKFWLDPILFDGTGVYNLRFWPPADGAYTIAYTYYIDHPKLASNAPHLVPARWENVITARTIIYIKEHEDETSLGPYERRFEREFARMKSAERRHPGALLGWRHELELQNIQRALLGNDPSLDLGR